MFKSLPSIIVTNTLKDIKQSNLTCIKIKDLLSHNNPCNKIGGFLLFLQLYHNLKIIINEIFL